MLSEPVLPVDEYTGPSFQGFVFPLGNPGDPSNGKTWTLTIATQFPAANYTAIFGGTWLGSGMGSGPGMGMAKGLRHGEIIDKFKSANELLITFDFQNGNAGPVTGNPGTSFFAGDLSYIEGYLVGRFHFVRPRWILQGSVTTTDGDGNVLDKGPGIVSGEVIV